MEVHPDVPFRLYSTALIPEPPVSEAVAVMLILPLYQPENVMGVIAGGVLST